MRSKEEGKRKKEKGVRSEERRVKREERKAGSRAMSSVRTGPRVAVAFSLLLTVCFLLVLSPLSAQAQTDLTGVKICIDPGHGGYNAANDRHVIPDAGTDFWESESNFQKALRLDTLLKARGAWVILTRYTNDYPADDDPSLSARWALANSNGVNWFHSIHSNATGGTNTTANYTLVLVKEDITTRQVVWPQAVTMSNIIGPGIQAKLRNTMRSTWTYLDYTFYGGTSGGFNLGVLNGLAMPGQLSEGSFHDFYPETRRLMNNLYRKMEAYALRNSFMQYFGAAPDSLGIIAGLQGDIATGKPINLSRVRLIPGDRVVTGDAYNNGFYMFDNVPQGTYTVRFETPGYTADSMQVTVGRGATVFVDRSLTSFAAPAPVTTAPVNGDTAYSAANVVTIGFSKPMDTASVRSAFSITPTIGGTLSWNANNTVLTFDPNGIFGFSVDYTVRIDTAAHAVSGQSIDGNGDGTGGDPFVLSFRTKYVDVFIPVITSSLPDSGRRLTSPVTVLNITYDERLNSATVLTSNYLIQQIPGSIQFRALEYAEANGRGGVTMYVPNGLIPGNLYRMRVTKVADLVGNTMPGTSSYLWDFSVGSGEYTNKVLDSLNPGSAGLRQPMLAADMQGADSVVVASVAGRLLGFVTGNTGSTGIRVVWDTVAAPWHVRIPADTSAVLGQTGFVKDGTLLRAHVFGDASGTRIRFAVRDGSGDREVSRWITCDWVGWRALTWDLELDSLGAGTGNGVLDGSLRFDGFELAYAPGSLSHVTAINVDQMQLIGRTVTGIAPDATGVPDRIMLHQNSPNPFNPSTRISYAMPSDGMVLLTVHDVLGREVARLVNGREAAGMHEVTWAPGASAASGLYLARLQVRPSDSVLGRDSRGGVAGFTGVVKMLLVK